MDWNYEAKYGPDTWGETYEGCSTDAGFQSPVRIDLDKLTPLVEDPGPFTWSNYDTAQKANVTNDAFTLALFFDDSVDSQVLPSISGGLLGSDRYVISA